MKWLLPGDTRPWECTLRALAEIIKLQHCLQSIDIFASPLWPPSGSPAGRAPSTSSPSHALWPHHVKRHALYGSHTEADFLISGPPNSSQLDRRPCDPRVCRPISNPCYQTRRISETK